MITSKQRAFLKSAANSVEAIFQVGKGGLTPEFVQMASDALEKRELIKISVLNNCEAEPNEIAQVLSERTRSDIVQIIGKKIVLYKKSEKHPVISSQLPPIKRVSK